MVFLINVTPINDICILSLHDALPISLDLDRFPELVNRDISSVVAGLEAEINLPRAARIIFPQVLPRVRQSGSDRREGAVGTIADGERHRPAAQIRVVGLPANIELTGS